jgi:hypothetical protein
MTDDEIRQSAGFRSIKTRTHFQNYPVHQFAFPRYSNERLRAGNLLVMKQELDYEMRKSKGCGAE